jgi:hypothetical protein
MTQDPADRDQRTQPELPAEVVAPASLGELLVVCLLPLAIAIGLNLWVARSLRDYPINQGYWLMGAKWDLLAGLQAPVSTLIVGDSSCNQGVRPDLLVERLGGTAVNLCTTGHMLAVGDAWIVGAYLERWGAPRRIVVVHSYEMWRRSGASLRANTWVYARHSAMFLHRAPHLDWTIEEQILLRIGAWVPFYTQPAATQELLFTEQGPRRRKFRIDADGYMPRRGGNRARTQRDMRKALARLGDGRFEMSPWNRAGLAELVRLADVYRVPMIFVHAPMYDQLWNDPRLRIYQMQLNADLDRAFRRSRYARLLSPEPKTFEARLMEAVDHVAGRGAKTFTRYLADELARTP